MTPTIRTARHTSYPALMLFGIVYLATLAIVASPESFRAAHATLDTVAQTAKGTP